MHGTLTLVFMNELEKNRFRAFLNTEIVDTPDNVVFLPAYISSEFQDAAITQGYWSTLRHCARLGMISGRGVVRQID